MDVERRDGRADPYGHEPPGVTLTRPPADQRWSTESTDGDPANGGSGSARLDLLLDSLVRRNNARVERFDAAAGRPRRLSESGELAALRASSPQIRAEWDRFDGGGSRLPTIDDLLGGYQGHVGSWWRAGPIVMQGRSVRGLGDRFPMTVAALRRVPNLRFAMWSVFGPGTELPEHVGANSGHLRLLFGVDCGPSAWIRIDGRQYAMRDGDGVLFEDTLPHHALNDSERPRVLLMCDLLRDLPPLPSVTNRLVQDLRYYLIPRYRCAAARAGEWDRALNGPPSAIES